MSDHHRDEGLHAGLPLIAALVPVLPLAWSFVYPSAAYPAVGVLVALGILLAVVLAALRVVSVTDRLQRGILALLILWAMLHVVMLYGRSPVYAFGRTESITAVLSVLVFLLPALYCGAMGGEFGHRGNGASGHRPLRLMAWGLLGALGLMAAHSLYQIWGPSGFPGTHAAAIRMIRADPTIDASDPTIEGILHALREGRAAGTLGAPNIFASFSLAGVFLGLALALSTNMPLRRGLALGAMAVCLLALFQSGSRGGVLAFFAGFSLFTVIGCFAVVPPAWARRAALVIVSTLVLTVVGFTLLIFYLSAENSRVFGVTTIAQRLYYWQTAWEIWRRDLILGAGPGSFRALYTLYRQPGSGETQQVHSWFFAQGVSVGIAGLGVFIAAVILLLLRAALRLRQIWSQRGNAGPYFFLVGIVCAFVAVLAHGLVEYTLAFREGSFLLFYLAGLVAVGSVDWSQASGRRARVTRANLLVLVMLVSLLILRIEMPAVRGEAAREEAIAMMEQRYPPAAILETWDRGIRHDPVNPALWEGRGVFRGHLGDITGEDDLRRALQLNARSARLHETLALSRARNGDTTAAIELQRRAIQLHSLDLSHRLTLAEFLLQANRQEEARQAILDAKGLRAINKAELARLHALQDQLGITRE